MRIMKSLVAGLCCSLFLVGCIPTAGIHPKSKTYVQCYVAADRIEVIRQEVEDKNVLYMSFGGDPIDNGWEVERIGAKYGDDHYNKRILPFSNDALSNVFTKVDVTSSADFNTYPAGTSLAGIVKVLSASPYQFIRNGYKGSYNWRVNMPDDWRSVFKEGTSFNFADGYFPVNKLASELTEQDMTMLCPGFVCIRFTEQPEIKEHTFTVTFYEGERAFKGSVEMVFTE